jgi:signal transduction histidine kinase
VGSDTENRSNRSRTSRIFRSIRFKIILLLIVPLVSLSILWAFAASLTLGDGLNLRHVQTLHDHAGYPAGALATSLQAERRLSVVYLGSKDPGDKAAMEAGRLVTDREVTQFRGLATSHGTQSIMNTKSKQLTTAILGQMSALGAQRQAIDTGTVSRAQAFTDFTSDIGQMTTLQQSLTPLSDPAVAQDSQTEVQLSFSREILAQEDALLAGALAAKHMTAAEHSQFGELVGTQRTFYSLVTPSLHPADLAYYQRITATTEFGRLRSLENTVIAHQPHGTFAPVDPGEWKTTADSVLTRLRGLELSATASADARTKPVASSIILRIVVAGIGGLLAVIISVLLSIWVGRSVIKELTRLKREALDLANERLPGVVRRLRGGERVDVAVEAPPLSFRTDEIDQVGQAFNAALRTAIQGAVEEASLRRSIGDVFLNLARRNQALLHRQLSLLDAMERRVAEPDELDDLFRLDHLATRMRRHAEGLIILSGQAPGRGWRHPVPAVDVARAAAAEVEDYARVTVVPMPRFSVSGPAVADLIHLLAELIENATLFSPPHTTVQVSGQAVAHGFALEIEDRGLSMDAASLATANERLAEPTGFDLSNSAQLGLFVVARLARRHDIKVTLRTSPYGGTTAIVLLPESIVVRSDDHGTDSPALPTTFTKRAEDALVPVGAIGGTAPALEAHPNGSPRRMRQNAGGGDHRPPLPQRRSAASPQPGRGADWADDGTVTGPLPAVAAAPMPDPGRPFRDLEPADLAPASDDPVHGGEPADTTWFTDEPGHQQPEPAEPIRSAGRAAPRAPRHEPRGVFEPATDESQPRRATSPPTGRTSLPAQGADSAAQRPVGAPRPGGPGAAAGPGAGAGAGGSGGGKPALPRRVKQASLAPQLRDDALDVPANQPAADPGMAGDRSPEELRSMLSSIQKGWLRGRSDADQMNDEENL